MIPAGSQSPHSMRTLRVLLRVVTLFIFSVHDLIRKPVLTFRDHALSRRHAQRAVEADYLAVEIAIADAVYRQRGEFTWAPQALGERHRGAERILCVLLQGA